MRVSADRRRLDTDLLHTFPTTFPHRQYSQIAVALMRVRDDGAAALAGVPYRLVLRRQ